MGDDSRVKMIDALDYFATQAVGLSWYDYEELRKLVDVRQTTMAIGYLPTRLAVLLAEDAEEMGLAAWKNEGLNREFVTSQLSMAGINRALKRAEL
jgi:hypothetical protein